MIQKDGLYDGQVDSRESVRNKGGRVLMNSKVVLKRDQDTYESNLWEIWINYYDGDELLVYVGSQEFMKELSVALKEAGF